jgi:hypothetical protein
LDFTSNWLYSLQSISRAFIKNNIVLTEELEMPGRKNTSFKIICQEGKSLSQKGFFRVWTEFSATVWKIPGEPNNLEKLAFFCVLKQNNKF